MPHDLESSLKIIVDGVETEVLRMPYHSQHRREGLCFVFSVKMCLGYFAGFYPNEKVRAGTQDLSIEELIKITNTRVETGTSITDAVCRRLSEVVGAIEFRQRLNTRTDDALRRLDDNLPTIVIYNGGFYEREELGPGHAGVLAGRLDDDPIFNNPWFGRHVRMNRIRLERSWEMEHYRAVLLNPGSKQAGLKDY